jgi:RHS repeat-associated protein
LRRLANVTSPAGAFGNEYYTGNPNGFANDLLQKLTRPNGAYTFNVYDSLGQSLGGTLFHSGGSVLDRSLYYYDHGGHRTNSNFSTSDWWDLAYDALGQLKSAGAVYKENEVPLPHEILTWGHDPANNIAWRAKGGLTNLFNNDSLNRLTTITRSGAMTVAGFATNNLVSATVNNQPAIIYGEGFAASGVALADGTNVFTAIAQDAYYRKATNAVTNVFPATITISYDANGNLTNDGKRRFEYDAENLLTNFFVSSQWRTELKYDAFTRRKVRKEYTWTNSAWRLTNEVRYIFDYMLVLQERNSNNIAQITYTRGSDLSGTFQGAGGIGGLLAMTTGTNAATYTNYYYNADGQGNITTILDTNQSVVASYAYEPFGNIWSQSGAFTNRNRMKQWSKEVHHSGLIFYERRIYDSVLNRWLTQDPIGEAGGINLYRFVHNSPIDLVDPWGFIDDLGNGILARVNSQGKPVVVYGGSVVPNYVERRYVNYLLTGDATYLEQTMNAISKGPLPGITYDLVSDAARNPEKAALLSAAMAGGLGSVGDNSQKRQPCPTGSRVTTEVKTRPSLGRDGATSKHIIERVEGEVNSVTHQVIKDDVVLHQHQIHVGKYGTRRQFPDEWINWPKIPGD